MLAVQQRREALGVAQIGGFGGEGRGDGAAVDAGDDKACVMQQFGGQMADLAKAKHGDFAEGHAVFSFLYLVLRRGADCVDLAERLRDGAGDCFRRFG